MYHPSIFAGSMQKFIDACNANGISLEGRKAIAEKLSFMQDGERDLLVANFLNRNLPIFSESAAEALMFLAPEDLVLCGFDWETSPEGGKFWSDLFKKYWPPLS
jgi:hypothetical protein